MATKKKTSANKATSKKNAKTAAATPTTEINVGEIAARTMLVSLDISQWGASKQDKKVGLELAATHGTSPSDGKYTKILVRGELIEKIHTIVSAARKEHWERTLPWFDDGFRILSAVGYFEYTQKMREYRNVFDVAVAAFLESYAEQIEKAKERLNGLFNVADYPTVDQLRGKFKFFHAVRALPQASDFRVKMAATDLETVRQSIELNAQEAIRGAMFETARRVHHFANHMADRLNAYGKDAKGKKTGTFRDSLVENVRELVDLLPSMNITNDSRIEAMRVELAALAQNDPDSLRDDAKLRETVASRAAVVRDAMADFM